MGHPYERKPPETPCPELISPSRPGWVAAPFPKAGNRVPSEALFALLPVRRTSPFAPHVVRGPHQR